MSIILSGGIYYENGRPIAVNEGDEKFSPTDNYFPQVEFEYGDRRYWAWVDKADRSQEKVSVICCMCNNGFENNPPSVMRLYTVKTQKPVNDETPWGKFLVKQAKLHTRPVCGPCWNL